MSRRSYFLGVHAAGFGQRQQAVKRVCQFFASRGSDCGARRPSHTLQELGDLLDNELRLAQRLLRVVGIEGLGWDPAR
jgi:hypothetical protein